MSKQGLKLGDFVKYYLVSLVSLSFLCLILYEVRHYSGQTTSSVKKDGDYKVQDISGETKSYNVDLKVTNDGDKVIQTYVFEYKK